MTKDFLSENIISRIVQDLIKQLNLQSDTDTKQKCESFVMAVINDPENETIEFTENDSDNYVEQLVTKCKDRYLQTLGYFKDQSRNNIFFEETNVKQLSRKLMKELNINSEDDFLICKTYVAIVMRMVYTEEIQKISVITDKILEELNKKTLQECIKMYKQQLSDVNK